ncbi:MAG: Gfo/Idh/MocA family protein [Paracoccaceae bacterium]
MFRWGILSTAGIARSAMIPGIDLSRNGVVSAIASRDTNKAKALAEQVGAPYHFGSYVDMLASDTIDAVYIPLPTSHHVDWSLKAAAAGKHVLCEKPIALQAEGIDRLIAARDQHGVTIAEAFMVYYHPQWHKVRDLIQDGAIGNLRHISGAFTYYNTDPNNMRNILELGGGALPDIGVYPTVTSRMVTGCEPSNVRAKIIRSPEFGTDIYADVSMDLGHCSMTYYVSTQMAQRQSMVFHGDKGWIDVKAPFNAGIYDSDTVVLQDQHRNVSQVFHFPGVNQYCLQAEAFADAAMGKGADIFTLENSRGNQLAVDAVYAAAEPD